MTWIEVPFEKNPADEDVIPFRYDWLVKNPTYGGYSLTSYTFKVYDENDLDVSADILNGTPTNDDKFILVPVKGGEHNKDYVLTGTIIFNKAGYPEFKKEWQMLIQVRQEGI